MNERQILFIDIFQEPVTDILNLKFKEAYKT